LLDARIGERIAFRESSQHLLRTPISP
jgi:hypothetical protein